MNYRKKESIIQAVKWTGDNLEEVFWLDHPGVKRMFTRVVGGKTQLRITTLAGVSLVPVGDYVVKGSMDELYMCSAGAFADNYETV